MDVRSIDRVQDLGSSRRRQSQPPPSPPAVVMVMVMVMAVPSSSFRPGPSLPSLWCISSRPVVFCPALSSFANRRKRGLFDEQDAEGEVVQEVLLLEGEEEEEQRLADAPTLASSLRPDPAQDTEL